MKTNGKLFFSVCSSLEAVSLERKSTVPDFCPSFFHQILLFTSQFLAAIPSSFGAYDISSPTYALWHKCQVNRTALVQGRHQ